MWQIKSIIILLFFSSMGIAQGRMNALGIGHYYHNQGISNAIDGIIELSLILEQFIKDRRNNQEKMVVIQIQMEMIMI